MTRLLVDVDRNGISVSRMLRKGEVGEIEKISMVHDKELNVYLDTLCAGRSIGDVLLAIENAAKGEVGEP